LEGYGLTETTCISSVNPYYGERKPGSIGMPLRGQPMKIVGPAGDAVDGDELGEIVIPDILECAVIGVPDEVRGEEVLAVVAPKPGAEPDGDELRRWTAERLAAFKVPSRFEIHRELPKTATGKISKPPLREQYGRWAPASASGS
jgi:acyl-CoA synthetase (AMP-forming)/AMP-acid ligase II